MQSSSRRWLHPTVPAGHVLGQRRLRRRHPGVPARHHEVRHATGRTAWRARPHWCGSSHLVGRLPAGSPLSEPRLRGYDNNERAPPVGRALLTCSLSELLAEASRAAQGMPGPHLYLAQHPLGPIEAHSGLQRHAGAFPKDIKGPLKFPPLAAATKCFATHVTSPNSAEEPGKHIIADAPQARLGAEKKTKLHRSVHTTDNPHWASTKRAGSHSLIPACASWGGAQTGAARPPCSAQPVGQSAGPGAC